MFITLRHKILFWLVIIGGLLLAPRLTGSPADQLATLRINEFVATNGSGLTDADGAFVDWLELYNASSRPINLGSWALTDDRHQPQKWPLPERMLPAGGYLVIYLSGKDRRAEEWHTNFKLQRAGEFLGLYNILTDQFVNEFRPTFTPQFRDLAYGRLADGTYGYLDPPTPGGANDSPQRWAGLVERLTFSHERGVYEPPFRLILTTTTPAAIIRYTTDNSEPTTTNGQLYHQPLLIDRTTVVRARAFKPGFLPSYLDTHSYIFLDDVLRQPADPPGFPATWGISSESFGGYETGETVQADYAMDAAVVNAYSPTIKADMQSLPIMSLVMEGQDLADIYQNPREHGRAWERPTSVEFFDPRGEYPPFQINAGGRIQGRSGRREFVPKHSFRLLFRGDYGPTKLHYPLFADSPVEEFDTVVLRAGSQRSWAGHPSEWRESQLSTYTRDEWLRATQLAVSGVGVHGRFVQLYVNGLYWGLYNLVERPNAAFMVSYFGGDKQDWYIVNQDGVISGPDDQLRQLLYGFASRPDPAARFAFIEPHLDMAQFADYLIINWYAGTKDKDWPRGNWFAAMPASLDQLNFFVWDAERTWLEGASVRLGEEEGVFTWPNIIKPLFDTLIQNPDFRLLLADRLYRHLFNDGPLTEANARARWLALTDQLDRAIVGESARWGDAHQEPPLTREDWLVANEAVLAQIEGNVSQLIELARQEGYYPSIDPPTFNQRGGVVESGFELTMTATEGQVFYTVDGSDPRQSQSGTVSPNALVYQQPLVLTETTHLKARLLAGEEWSALQEAIVTLARPVTQPLRISEVMYHSLEGEAYEFIELQNIGERPAEVANLSFTAGIRYTFPPDAPPVSPGGLVVLVRQAAPFEQKYPGVPIAGVYEGRLSNQGERLTLQTVTGQVVDSVAYADRQGWPVSADGRGDSLVRVDLRLPGDQATNWRASRQLHGTPGRNDDF